MKKFRNIIAVALLTLIASTASAQMVNTTYFLENSPYRHYLNPAIEPLSKMYLSFPVLGGLHADFSTGGLALSDIIYNYKIDGVSTPILFMNPNDPNGVSNFLKRLNGALGFNMDMQINLFSFGFRCKERGYFHFNVNERISTNFALPAGLFQFLLGGGMKDLSLGGSNSYDLSQTALNADVYTEIALGYSHIIGDHWRIGFKLKGLLGTAHISMANKSALFNASIDEWSLKGNGALEFAAPVSLPEELTIDNLLENEWMPTITDMKKDILNLLKPQGFGIGMDFGLTYSPIKMLQITAAVSDLGIMRWHKGYKYNYNLDAKYDGIGSLNFNEMIDADGNFNFNSDTITTSLQEAFKNVLQPQEGQDAINAEKEGFSHMLSPNLNVGVDLNFWQNRIGVGIYSRTKFTSKIYEEVTIGAAFRPCHWFQLAASYSFMNGRWSNVGAALGIVTYEGIGLTLAADYVPCSYASCNINGKDVACIPYKTPGVNFSFGLNIVVGHVRDHDHDGVWDAYDKCPGTPRKVTVDQEGCPMDEDGDGVPDYLDECPGTPAEAQGLVDLNGCPLDSDGDGVPDYMDQCLNTPYGVAVDSLGCPLDSDHDGVADHYDLCPDTPEEAIGMVDQNGCPIDTDGDGVYDYKDECPDTPYGIEVDEQGCPKDDDGDGVPNYMDNCPDTPAGAPVDANGCPLDSDGDGVPDYLDQCPNTPAGAIVNEYGCFNDSDNDGVSDNDDECPNTPVGVAVDAKGCPVDSDGDGVPDYLDKCPTVAGDPANGGCPVLDSDGDGVPDDEDACPYVPGDPANNGCPVIQKAVTNLLSRAMEGIQFETGKAIIKKTSYPILNEIANVFKEHPEYRIEVQGHTDNTGNPERNMELSEQRASAVMSYLVKKGVPMLQMVAVGYGDTRPIETNETAEGRAINRRVEFIINFEETKMVNMTVDEINGK